MITHVDSAKTHRWRRRAITGAVVNNTGEILAGSAILEGEYGRRGVSMGVPLRLGSGGIQETVEYGLAPDERIALDLSVEHLKAAVRIMDDNLG